MAQLSLAVGAVKLTAALQAPASLLCVMFAGMPAMTGDSLSVTVTVKDDVVVLPTASMAVYVTVVVPTAKVSPLSWVEVNESTPQLSAAVGGV